MHCIAFASLVLCVPYSEGGEGTSPFLSSLAALALEAEALLSCSDPGQLSVPRLLEEQLEFGSLAPNLQCTKRTTYRIITDA